MVTHDNAKGNHIQGWLHTFFSMATAMEFLLLMCTLQLEVVTLVEL